MPKIKDGSLAAWIDKMPGSEPKLIAKIEIEVPTTGWTWSLKKAVPQGVNPDVLILDLNLTRPSGESGQVVSRLEPRFEEAPPKHRYTDVMVRFDGGDYTTKVGEAQ